MVYPITQGDHKQHVEKSYKFITTCFTETAAYFFFFTSCMDCVITDHVNNIMYKYINNFLQMQESRLLWRYKRSWYLVCFITGT